MKLLCFANTDWYLYNYRMPIDLILKEKGYTIVMVSPPGKYVKNIKAAGFRWRPITMSRCGMNPLRESSTIRQLTNIYEEEKPDIVHHFTIKCNLYGSIAARLAHVPIVIDSIAGLGYVFASPAIKARLLRPFGYWSYKLSLSNSKVIFQNTEDRFRFVSNNYVKEKDAYLIKSSGVDLAKFLPQPIPQDQINILLGSRMLWTKGIGEFVEAAKIVKKQYPQVNFLLAGDVDSGNPSSITPEKLRSWEDQGYVKWLGFQENMPELLKNCHLVCFPSKHTEGTPKFLIEAAATARPIITTQNRGCKEVVDDNVNGFLVPKGEHISLANAIFKLLNNRSLVEKMGMMSRIKAEKEFSLNKVAHDTHQVYSNALQELRENMLMPNLDFQPTN
ncbi:glycosyltransferase involved in cell wall biosynthesis [Catalinimonas alkaloidigena]|uniref:glycosyltransferase family 4 protein n=1 Tax=Catalinimonas alkaloidigena TaxID=1075417 RepID=UPI0024057DEA|nr:glycosyltransferase family 4 protein [Catalinimonas alkaloidigena]MDF9799686.1 glycosyltransferase involved in cell wall biosynthesis [Catalinimonas alkaloidigena]